jgi:hypothetical protein
MQGPRVNSSTISGVNKRVVRRTDITYFGYGFISILVDSINLYLSPDWALGFLILTLGLFRERTVAERHRLFYELQTWVQIAAVFISWGTLIILAPYVFANSWLI